VSGDLVYVLNAGSSGNIAGFQLDTDGTLTAIAGSVRPLSSAASGPAEVAFSPDGRFLVVTEKATSTIVVYSVGDDGAAGPPVVSPAEGQTPFGFSFGHRGILLVSEASGGAPGASTVSSYELLPDGHLQPVTSALATTQSAACWLVATGDGRYAYTTNTGSDTLTGLAVERDGTLRLLANDGVTAPAGDAPIDAAFSRNGRYLYVLSGNDDRLSEYRVGADGSLVPLGQIVGLPASVNGLAAD
jgi:6-phosphogluconolactonase (cycloisomerase 2 family)